MIVVDTSVLMAILKTEPGARDCWLRLKREQQVSLSAGTLTEAMIVATRQGYRNEMQDLIALTVSDVIDVTPSRAEHAASAYARWGKGFHPAGLNFGDCFSYALAAELDCALLFIGNDFARTDIRSALAG
jgi:ribonuclease VapC